MTRRIPRVRPFIASRDSPTSYCENTKQTWTIEKLFKSGAWGEKGRLHSTSGKGVVNKTRGGTPVDYKQGITQAQLSSIRSKGRQGGEVRRLAFRPARPKVTLSSFGGGGGPSPITRDVNKMDGTRPTETCEESDEESKKRKEKTRKKEEGTENERSLSCLHVRFSSFSPRSPPLPSSPPPTLFPTSQPTTKLELPL